MVDVLEFVPHAECFHSFSDVGVGIFFVVVVVVDIAAIAEVIVVGVIGHGQRMMHRIRSATPCSSSSSSSRFRFAQ